MSWIVICISCQDCGGDLSFKITEKQPTEKEIKDVQQENGGGFCISTYVKEIAPDTINSIEKN